MTIQRKSTDAPRRSAESSRRSTEKSRGKRPRASDDSEPRPLFALPWPRDPVPFDLPSSWRTLSAKQILRLPEYGEHLRNREWDHFDSLFYNGMLGVTMEPTRLLSGRTLGRLGLKRQMQQLIVDAGLGTITTEYYPLYPDLARQFIASCHVFYEGYGTLCTERGRLRFKVNGLCYTLTFADICECFGFDVERQRTRLPEGFPDSQVLWDEIAKDTYKASISTQRDIRHPVLRLFVKALGHTLLCSMENSKMRLKQLIILSYAIGDRWDESHSFVTQERVNFGALFAYHLEEQKEKALSPQGKVESIGSLITPLLQRAGVHLPTGEGAVVESVLYLDEAQLKRGNHIRLAGKGRSEAQQWNYMFLSMSGNPLHTLLPTPYADIDTLEDLRFILPEDDLYRSRDRFARTQSRGSGSRGGAAMEEDLPAYEPLGPYERASEEVLADTIAYRRHQENRFERLWNFLRCTRVRDDVAPSTRRSTARQPPSATVPDTSPDSDSLEI